jgi:hypothetical protein
MKTKKKHYFTKNLRVAYINQMDRKEKLLQIFNMFFSLNELILAEIFK